MKYTRKKVKVGGKVNGRLIQEKKGQIDGGDDSKEKTIRGSPEDERGKESRYINEICGQDHFRREG